MFASAISLTPGARRYLINHFDLVRRVAPAVPCAARDGAPDPDQALDLYAAYEELGGEPAPRTTVLDLARAACFLADQDEEIS